MYVQCILYMSTVIVFEISALVDLAANKNAIKEID